MSLLNLLRKETAKLEEIKGVMDSKMERDKKRKLKAMRQFVPPAPKKKPMTKEQKVENFHALRRKCIDKIADKYIYDAGGQEAYKRTASGYNVIGKYNVAPEFIDIDHALRDVNGFLREPERIAALKILARRLGVKV
jgi:hypothetical protein